MAKHSAGLLLYRWRGNRLEVFLVHPGGPYWAKRDDQAWSIPKGEFDAAEDALSAARREFAEETGFEVDGDFVALEPLKQPSGKIVHAWALEADVEAAAVKSNTFPMEWPPRSGKLQEFPEVDRAGWFDIATARRKLVRGQIGFLDRLERRLEASAGKGRAK